MRRLILILLLVVYPFQVALAMADKCCAMTPAGVSHHSVEAEAGSVFVADDGASLADSHCAACTFGHTACLPVQLVVVPAERRHASGIDFFPPYLKAPPASRPERPQWPAAA
ncbi:hypothetical protein GCM10025794_10630 [Massilia kyonggiensis]|nr:hypothetical protein [Massilia kyonggiensis]